MQPAAVVAYVEKFTLSEGLVNVRLMSYCSVAEVQFHVKLFCF